MVRYNYSHNQINNKLAGRSIGGQRIVEVVPDPDIYGGGTVKTADGRWHSVRNQHDPKIR